MSHQTEKKHRRFSLFKYFKHSKKLKEEKHEELVNGEQQSEAHSVPDITVKGAGPNDATKESGNFEAVLENKSIGAVVESGSRTVQVTLNQSYDNNDEARNDHRNMDKDRSNLVFNTTKPSGRNIELNVRKSTIESDSKRERMSVGDRKVGKSNRPMLKNDVKIAQNDTTNDLLPTFSSNDNRNQTLYPKLEDFDKDPAQCRSENAKCRDSLDYVESENEFSEIEDNLKNEHIEEVKLSRYEEERTSVQRNQGMAHPDAYNVIPEDMDAPLLAFYAQIMLLLILVHYSYVIAAMYLLALLCYSRPAATRLQTIGKEISNVIESAGISTHAVIWVLLASFGNIYIAMAYAAVIGLYIFVLSVIREIATAIAQLIASLVVVLFIGPVIALFSAIFAFPTGVRNAGLSQSGERASLLLEGMMKIFLFPFYLPVLLLQFKTQQRNRERQERIERARPSRDCDILRRLFNSGSRSCSSTNSQRSTYVSRERPSRGCDLCRLLFGKSRGIHRSGNPPTTSSGKIPVLSAGKSPINFPRHGNFHSPFPSRAAFHPANRASRDCGICRRLFR